MDDLFDETETPQPVAASKKACLCCGAITTHRWQVLCKSCSVNPSAAMDRLASEVATLESAWRDPLRTASDATQERWVAVLAAESDAYAAGDNRTRRQRIIGFRQRLERTKNARGEIAVIAQAYDRYIARRGDLQTVTLVVMLGKAGQPVEGAE